MLQGAPAGLPPRSYVPDSIRKTYDAKMLQLVQQVRRRRGQ